MKGGRRRSSGLRVVGEELAGWDDARLASELAGLQVVAWCPLPDERDELARGQLAAGTLVSCLRRPASERSRSALSVRSQGRSRSGRPKCPYAAVCR